MTRQEHGTTKASIALATIGDVLLSTKDVMVAVNVSRPSLYRWVADGYFPKPIKIGPRRVAWSSSAVSAWIETRKAA